MCMITNKEAIRLLRKWPISSGPEYREPICADCGRIFRKAWHVHCHDLWFKREIHLCIDCGKKYGMIPKIEGEECK